MGCGSPCGGAYTTEGAGSATSHARFFVSKRFYEHSYRISGVGANPSQSLDDGPAYIRVVASEHFNELRQCVPQLWDER